MQNNPSTENFLEISKMTFDTVLENAGTRTVIFIQVNLSKINEKGLGNICSRMEPVLLVLVKTIFSMEFAELCFQTKQSISANLKMEK